MYYGAVHIDNVDIERFLFIYDTKNCRHIDIDDEYEPVDFVYILDTNELVVGHYYFFKRKNEKTYRISNKITYHLQFNSIKECLYYFFSHILDKMEHFHMMYFKIKNMGPDNIIVNDMELIIDEYFYEIKSHQKYLKHIDTNSEFQKTMLENYHKYISELK